MSSPLEFPMPVAKENRMSIQIDVPVQDQTLKNHCGDEVQLSGFWAEGPLVLILPRHLG